MTEGYIDQGRNTKEELCGPGNDYKRAIERKRNKLLNVLSGILVPVLHIMVLVSAGHS